MIAGWVRLRPDLAALGTQLVIMGGGGPDRGWQ
jgi:inosine-uridine nucleoside N-ribohydrolase